MCCTEDLTNSPRQPALKCLWISLQNSFEVLDIPKGNGNDKATDDPPTLQQFVPTP